MEIKIYSNHQKNSSNEAFNSSNEKKVVQMSKTIKFKLTKTYIAFK